jgi:hypothetical protein
VVITQEAEVVLVTIILVLAVQVLVVQVAVGQHQTLVMALELQMLE